MREIGMLQEPALSRGLRALSIVPQKISQEDYMKPCARCKHAFEEHAPDVSYPEALRCFHLAGTGEGCTEKYDERCRDYVDPDATVS
jgi:hypothetical protein